MTTTPPEVSAQGPAPVLVDQWPFGWGIYREAILTRAIWEAAERSWSAYHAARVGEAGEVPSE